MELDCQYIPNGFPEDISSEFPCLKSLYVRLFKNMEKINLLSYELENLTLSDMRDLDEAIIDTPNLHPFKLIDMEKDPSGCPVVGSRLMEVEIGLENARTTNSLLELRVFAGNLGGNISLSFDTTELKVLLDELKGQKTNRSKRYKSSDYMYWSNALKSFEILESTTTTKEGAHRLSLELHWYLPIMNTNAGIPQVTESVRRDEFDQLLFSALKTYQLNFNLNITGEFDIPTLQHMVKPRCGNPDIVNGTTHMNSGKTPTDHTVAHFLFFKGQPRWPSSKSKLKYAFLPENQLTDSIKVAFRRAFDKWSKVTLLTFKEMDSYRLADIQIGFFVRDHGDGNPFDGPMKILAHTFAPPTGFFHLDGEDNWVVDGEYLKEGMVDLESVAVHEIGHLLGLDHSSEKEAIMFPTLEDGTRKVELSRDDIEGVQMLYGSNPNYNGSSTVYTHRQENDISGYSTFGSLCPHWIIGFLLVLLLSISI
ncbi:hypothetical protein KY289_023396 [Solanum tuberosum]|nr:hypothetical protein KY289_023396 [Solanum tuberosum]